MEIAGKSNLKYINDAVDLLRKSPRTSSLDTKSLRIVEYNDLSAYFAGFEKRTGFKLGFTVSGEPHVAEFVVQERPAAMFSYRLTLVYAVLDGHFDLLANTEIW